MGFFSHRVGRSEIVAGDHVYTYRNGYAYSHHGIYVSKNEVVHFGPRQPFSFSVCECGYVKSKGGVVLSCLDCFLSGGSLYRYQYGTAEPSFILKRGGTCTMAKSDLPELAISRAMHLLNSGFGDYDLAVNNCEHFALYCKTSLRTIKRSTGGSGQITGFTGTCKAVLKSCTLMAVPSFIASSAVLAPIGTVIGAGLYSRYRLESDLSVRKDVVRVEVADLVPFRRFKVAKELNKVERDQIVAGDHVYTWRNGYDNSHHGIYIGGDKVVHFTSPSSDSSKSLLDCPPYCGMRHEPESGTVLTCINCFISGGSLYLYEYGAILDCIFGAHQRMWTVAKSDVAEEVLARAMYLLRNGFGDYDVLKNNSEHFALYCKTNRLEGVDKSVVVFRQLL